MEKQPLNNRKAIQLLVDTFYTKVKSDEVIGFIFNNAENFSWDTHIPVMVNFWEAVLMNTAAYKGNAMGKHIELNRKTPLKPEHFERWKELFYSTLDTLFEGPEVALAKKRAEAMSELIQFKIEQSQQKGFIQ